MTFFTPDEVAALQELALPAMQTEVTIARQVVTAGSTTATDYGDDDVSYAVSRSSTSTVMGWFRSTPTPEQVLDTGQILTVNTYRLNVPVGTDIRPGDQVTVGTAVYIVSDTTEDRTWPVMLVCSLRRSE